MKNFFKKFGQKQDLLKSFLKSEDYHAYSYKNKKSGASFQLIYIKNLVDEKMINESVLPYLLEGDFRKIEDVKAILPLPGVQFLTDEKEMLEKLYQGYVWLKMDHNGRKYCLFPVVKEDGRAISLPEVEFSVVGPKEAFVESIDQNLYLIRKRLPIKELVIEELNAGSLSNTKVAIVYIDGIANKENVNTVRQRIENIDYDIIVDSSFVIHLISDSVYSIFPQLLDTERPDRVVSSLAEGKISIIVDGSPHALIGPSTLVEFFGAFEDYFLNWMLASFFRLIRVFAVAYSILAAPIYVAIMTYHYELVPQDMLNALVTSRRIVPFPPILEALFLEITIELLREAGARLPTKVGQTIGIVGGIVIGTASVEAGLTSNVLLIIIALAALASFTTPVYKMGNTIRVLRFPFFISAQLWGLLGIVICFCFVLTHLIRVTSLGRPMLEPIYPPRIGDFKDSLIRLPIFFQVKRPFYLEPEKKTRIQSKKRKDIDE